MIIANKPEHRVIAIAAVAHALFLLGWWWAAIYADIDIPLITGRVWLVCAWAWMVSPIYAIVRTRLSRLTVAGLVLGAAPIAPTLTTVYAF